jgi:hypothetical protein
VAAAAFIVARKLAAASQLKEIANAQKRMQNVRASTLRGTTKRMRDGGF